MSFALPRKGFKGLLPSFCALRRLLITRCFMNATGALPQRLERALAWHLPKLVKIVNPLQARRFAQAQGMRGKK